MLNEFFFSNGVMWDHFILNIINMNSQVMVHHCLRFGRPLWGRQPQLSLVSPNSALCLESHYTVALTFSEKLTALRCINVQCILCWSVSASNPAFVVLLAQPCFYCNCANCKLASFASAALRSLHYTIINSLVHKLACDTHCFEIADG